MRIYLTVITLGILMIMAIGAILGVPLVTDLVLGVLFYAYAVFAGADFFVTDH